MLRQRKPGLPRPRARRGQAAPAPVERVREPVREPVQVLAQALEPPVRAPRGQVPGLQRGQAPPRGQLPEQGLQLAQRQRAPALRLGPTARALP